MGGRVFLGFRQSALENQVAVVRLAASDLVIDRVVQYGGKVRMDIMRYHPEDDNKPYKMVYLEDPFGNLFELYSHTYKETYSSEYE